MSEKDQLLEQRRHEMEIIRRKLYVDTFLESMRQKRDASEATKNADTALTAFDGHFKGNS